MSQNKDVPDPLRRLAIQWVMPIGAPVLPASAVSARISTRVKKPLRRLELRRHDVPRAPAPTAIAVETEDMSTALPLDASLGSARMQLLNPATLVRDLHPLNDGG